MAVTDITTTAKPGKPEGKERAKEQEQQGEVARPMREHRQSKVAEGIKAHFEAEEEIYQLKETVAGQRRDLTAKDMEIASLRERMDAMREDNATTLNAAESRAMTAQAERDTAVSETVALKTIIASMKRIFDLAPP